MSAIERNKFYGEEVREYHTRHDIKVRDTVVHDEQPEKKRVRQHLFGPSEFWGEYWKQQEALDVARHSTSSLCTFVYQNTKGFRKFVVAHPEIYWQREQLKPKLERCSYEVIPESAPCHLYFDLEYQIDANQSSNGSRMTKTLIDIFCKYIFEHWGYICTKSNVLSLDSTSDVKFSRHLIFRAKKFMFKNNIHAGRFVKHVCAEIRKFLLSNEESNRNILSRYDRKDLEELFVNTSNNKKMFIDEAVYTRNRHFRIYKATKWGKNSHLVESSDTEYVSGAVHRDKELGTFLDSLISFVPKSNNLILLEFKENASADAIKYSKDCLSQINCSMALNSSKESPFPKIDNYIQDIVNPGKIRDIKYLEKCIIYEIAGNRYCANIGRYHKGNNIMWIVDLHKKIAYQKCHDVDCTGFKSVPKKLPEELCFQLDDENDILLSSVPEFEGESHGNNLAAALDDSFDSDLANIEINASLAN